MLYELRRYEIRDGRRAEWVAFMESTIIPFQVGKGIVVAGSFISENEPEVFYWIRRFDNEEDRVKRYQAVYEDPTWVSTIKPTIDALLNRETVKVTRLIPTPSSVLA